MYLYFFYCRICDRLHCTSCDNKVVSFDNFEWHKSCDYLFFRNNYPDFSKLKSNMIPRAGTYVLSEFLICIL